MCFDKGQFTDENEEEFYADHPDNPINKKQNIMIIKKPEDLEILLNSIKKADYPNERIVSHLDIDFQNGPIKENGINGVQFTGLIEIALEVLKKLNGAFPCRENSITITKLEEALMWQEARTKDREKRLVEGKNEA